MNISICVMVLYRFLGIFCFSLYVVCRVWVRVILCIIGILVCVVLLWMCLVIMLLFLVMIFGVE